MGVIIILKPKKRPITFDVDSSLYEYEHEQLLISDSNDLNIYIPKLLDQRLPYLDASKTAMFTTLGTKKMIPFHSFYYRKKIIQDLVTLLDYNVENIIVSYGNPYGKFALRELLKLKEKGYCFSLYSNKVLFETTSLFYNDLTTIFYTRECDNYLGLQTSDYFLFETVKKCSYISYEAGLLNNNQKIPHSLLVYYTKHKQNC